VAIAVPVALALGLDVEPQGVPIRGGDWAGHRLLLSSAGAIWLIDAKNVASRTRLTTPDERRELWHGWPMFLGDGPRFVYTAALTSGGMETRIGSIDGGRNVRVALPANVTRVRYDRRGYLVYGHNGALMAQQIDPETGALRGSPVRVGSEVLQNPRTAWAAVLSQSIRPGNGRWLCPMAIRAVRARRSRCSTCASSPRRHSISSRPSANGQRFLVRRPLRPGGADTAPVHVLVNWFETLPSSARP